MTAPESSLVDRLSSDVVSLISALRSPWTWILTLALSALVVGAWRLRVSISQDRRLTPRVRAVASASLTAATVAIVAIVATWFLWKRAPLLLGVALAVLAAAAGFGIAIRGRAWVWGLVMIWRGRVRIGDRMRFAAIEGNVVDVGIFGITVNSDDGARVFIPSSKLSADTFSVASPEEAHPAEVTIRLVEREMTDADLDLLARIGTLCPYRHRAGPVTVQPGGDRRSATVTFRSWSEEGAKLAREHVQGAFGPGAARSSNSGPARDNR